MLQKDRARRIGGRAPSGLLILSLFGGFLALAGPAKGQVAPASSSQEALVSKEGLVDALKVGGRDAGYPEILEIIRKRGVNFDLPEACEQLVEAGARVDLLKTARGAYVKPPEPPKPREKPILPGPALLLSESLVLLQAGIPSNRLEEMIQLRGVCYQLTPGVSKQIQGAGADANTLAVLGKAYRDCRQPCTVPPEGFVEMTPQRAVDYDPAVFQGRFDVKLEVDQSVDVVLRGSTVYYRATAGQRPLNIGSEYTQAIPTGELILLDVERKEARGTWKLLEKPTATNCHSVRIHIDDPKNGAGKYHLRVFWRRK